MGKKKKKKSFGLKIIFVIYLFIVFAFVILKYQGSWAAIKESIVIGGFGSNYNLTPLASIKLLWADMPSWNALINFLGNTLPFVPFGILLPASDSRKRFVSVVCGGLLFVLASEIIQYFTGLGVFDIDDIILNMAGIILGYLIWGIIYLIKKE